MAPNVVKVATTVTNISGAAQAMLFQRDVDMDISPTIFTEFSAIDPIAAPVIEASFNGFENADPLWRAISLARDQVPSVALVAPGRDLQVQPGSKVEVAVEARDDYGMEDVRILYRVNDSQEVKELRRFPHPGGHRGRLAGTHGHPGGFGCCPGLATAMA